ncbi:MAG: hypothetical protein V2B18_16350, partial [Pseudomonadota bacterium]
LIMSHIPMAVSCRMRKLRIVDLTEMKSCSSILLLQALQRNMDGGEIAFVLLPASRFKTGIMLFVEDCGVAWEGLKRRKRDDLVGQGGP